jgi:hypothetical protein
MLLQIEVSGGKVIYSDVTDRNYPPNITCFSFRHERGLHFLLPYKNKSVNLKAFSKDLFSLFILWWRYGSYISMCTTSL